MQQVVTFPALIQGLSNLGVTNGEDLLVHCSMSSFGQVYGGAQSIIESLTHQVGSEGTIVMPTLTNGRFDPSEWSNPPSPPELWDEIRYTTPLFDPQKTPCDQTMSAVYELFRTWPGSSRSTHSHSSFAAWGKHRDELLIGHRLDDRFGETSPLAKLYDIDAKVLFLGSDFSTNTCFHLAEYRRSNPPTKEFKIVIEMGGEKSLETYTDVNTNSSVFNTIGADFEASGFVKEERIGQARCVVFSLRDAVDFATEWFESINKHRYGDS